MSKRCKIMVGFFLFLIACFLGYLLLVGIYYSGLFVPVLQLKGDISMTIQIHEQFQDPGYRSYFRFRDVSKEVVCESNVNIHEVGTYEIRYRLNNGTSKKRMVHVVDTIAPTLMLNGPKTVRIFLNQPYHELGYRATDNADHILTDQVKVKGRVNTKKVGTYVITYSVQDQSHNRVEVKRNVMVCMDPTNQTLYYDYDHFNNDAFEWWFQKSVHHKRPSAAKDEAFLAKYDAYYLGKDEPILYLTFDEGGNDVTYTKPIADILNKHQVKATFFFTRNYIRDEATFMQDLVKHGHVIGNHTWHHYDLSLYANKQEVNTFVRELSETEKTYIEVVGKPMPKVFRFPKGGCSERTLKMVQDLGYRTFFWSHAYYDYAYDVSKEEALKTLKEHVHPGAIYLLHPSNKGNYEALEEFIIEMKKKGYTFDTVDHIGL